MSRVDYYYPESLEEVMAAGRWARNSVTTLNSKRGQTALRELRDALLALPQKRLVTDTFCEVDEEGNINACVLGALALHKGFKPDDLIILDGESASETADWASNNLGLVYTLAWNLVEMNDEQFSLKTPEQRYEAFMEWLNYHIHGSAGATA